MKTFSPGLSDSIAGIVDEPRPCPHCQSSSQIAGGLCVGCLLEAGLDPADDAEAETLSDILAEVRLPDQNWRLGNYEILEEIGRGGMGVIYRARQRHSRRIVAVKRVLSYHADSRETLARFRREAQAAASLDHPNILPIFEVSESEDGLPFFSMKFAPGGTLQQVAPALRKDPRQCVALVAKITRAVQYAHSRGILHRDLKPGNILLDGRGEPLVSDFGLAKWLDTSSDLTRTLTIFGTPGYIAPEQASSAAAELKPTADIYSLGAILFDLLAGRPPFLGTHALSVIRQAAESPAPKLRTLSKLADRDLETICSRCLERDPKLRYPSAHDLAEDLERWLEGRPIKARPVSSPVKVWRWSKRNPKLVLSLGVSVSLALAATLRHYQSAELRAQVERDVVASRSIAVLPFLNLDTAMADAKWSDAVARVLEGELTRVKPARITSIAATEPWLAGAGTAMDLRVANEQRNARALIAGTVRRAKQGFRFSLRVVNPANADVLLAHSFELTDGQESLREALQAMAQETDRILAVANWDALGPSKRDAGMTNEAAREYIISGRQLMLRANIPDIDRAIGCFEKALSLTPNSALAHAYLASAAAARLHFAPQPDQTERIKAESEKSLRLAADLPEAHRALAGLFYHTGDLTRSLEEQFRAIEVGGAEERVVSLAGMTLLALGRPDRALGWLEMAKHWAVMPGDYDGLIGDCWMLLGDDKNAEDAYRRSLNLRPEIADGWVGLSHLRLIQNRSAEARNIWQDNRERRLLSQEPDSDPRQLIAQIEFFVRNFDEAARLFGELDRTQTEPADNFYGALDFRSALGRVQQAKGDFKTATKTLQSAKKISEQTLSTSRHGAALYRMAAVQSCLGQTDESIDYLKRAINAGWSDARSPRLDPRFDGVAKDPRFFEILAALLDKMATLRRQIGQPLDMAANSTNSGGHGNE